MNNQLIERLPVPRKGRTGLALTVGELARAWRTCFDNRLRPLCMSQAAWLVVWALHTAGEPLSQVRLARIVSIEGSTLVRHLDRLEKDGLVRRVQDVKDRRANRIVLTEKAQALAREIIVLGEEMNRDILGDIPEADLVQAHDTLLRIMDRLSELT